MIRILTNHYEGDLDEVLCNEFGPCLEKKNFQTWLEENEIEYGSSAWRS